MVFIYPGPNQQWSEGGVMLNMAAMWGQEVAVPRVRGSRQTMP